MSYPFENEKIVNITYTNPERDTIEIIWDSGDGTQSNFLTFYGESSDANLQKWLLANNYTDEVIYDNTRDKNAFDSKNFAQMIVKYAEPYIKKIEADYETHYQAFIRKTQEEMEPQLRQIEKDYEENYQNFIKKTDEEYEENYQKFIKTSEAKWNAKFNKMVELKDLATHKSFSELKKQAEKEAKKQSDIIDIISTNNNDSELLFKAKLALFEKDVIKNSKDKELKTKIRRAKTLTELLGTIDGHI